jgi:hypothetical protein
LRNHRFQTADQDNEPRNLPRSRQKPERNNECPTVCVIIEANEVLPVTDFVNPALMFKLVRKYPTAMRISQKPSRRSPKANQVLSVVRSGGLSI